MADFKGTPSVQSGSTPPQKGGDPEKKRLAALFLIPLVFFLVLQFLVFPNIEVSRMPYSEFYQMIQRNPQTGEIVSCEMVEDVIRGKLKNGGYFQVNVPENDPELFPTLRRNVPSFTINPPQLFWRNLLYSVLPVLLLIAFFWFLSTAVCRKEAVKFFLLENPAPNWPAKK